MNSSRIFTCITLCVSPVAVQAASMGDTQHTNAVFDLDSNGLLERPDIMLGLTCAHNPSTDPFAVKRDYIKKKKLPAFLENPSDDLLIWYAILIQQMDAGAKIRPPYPLDAIDPKKFGVTAKMAASDPPEVIAARKYESKWDFKIRRNKDELAKGLKDPYAQGAIFSYGRDLDIGEYSLTGRGIIALSYEMKENEKYDIYYNERLTATEKPGANPPPRIPNVNFLRASDFAFTFDFDRLKPMESKPATGTDSLTFGVHWVADFVPFHKKAVNSKLELDERQRRGEKLDSAHFGATADPFLKSLLLDISGNWTTDSDFRRNIQSIDIDISPRLRLPGMGSYESLFPYGSNASGQPVAHALAARWDTTVHGEIGTIEEAGNTANKFDSDGFVRVGGRASLELLIAPEALDSRFSLNFSYLLYPALTGDTPENGLFRATAQWALSFGSGFYSKEKSGSYVEKSFIPTLRLEYQKGTLPKTFEEDESLLIGLGLLF